VSLSPANYETWLRDTSLVDVDEQRFRIAVPNGFAKDWLENRYRSLISQTLARIVGYSVQVEFIVNALNAAHGTSLAPEFFARLGRETLRLEADFNRLAGFTERDDELPGFFYSEPLAPTNHVARFHAADVHHMYERLPS